MLDASTDGRYHPSALDDFDALSKQAEKDFLAGKRPSKYLTPAE